MRNAIEASQDPALEGMGGEHRTRPHALRETLDWTRPRPGPTRVDEGLVEPRPGLERARLHPGQRIEGTRYRIVRWLGEGAMGEVYEAEHVDIQRRTAVKILRAEVSHDDAVVEAFRNEARAACRVGSELIVDIYDFVPIPDGRLMICMKLLEGTTLWKALAGPMEVPRAVGILRQVARGLAAAHGAGVVHRDIKPENIFLTRRDDREDAVKLLDFGISAIHDGSERMLLRAGTPHYTAPEVISGGSVDASVDIYAWGCLAYEVLTGRLPFDGDTHVEIFAGHLEREAALPSRVRSSLPPAFDALVMGCLAKDPAQRIASMTEVEAALCEAQLAAGIVTTWDDLSLPPVEDERRERLMALLPTSPEPRHPWGRVLVLMLLVGLVGVAAGLMA